MENNQNNNRDTRPSVRTRDIQFMNTRSAIQSALEVTFSDDMIRLTFTPPLPEAKRGEKRFFDYDNQVYTALARVKVQELLNRYEEIIVPALEAKVNKTISVPVGTVNQFGIGTGVGLVDDDEVHPYVFLIRDIDSETLTSNNVIAYVFGESESLEDYEPKTGEYKVRKVGHAEFDLFISDLREFKAASSKSYVHAARCVDRAYKDMISGNIEKLMEHSGIEIPREGGRGNRNTNYGSIFSGGPKSSTPAETTSYSNFDDLAEALG